MAVLSLFNSHYPSSHKQKTPLLGGVVYDTNYSCMYVLLKV